MKMSHKLLLWRKRQKRGKIMKPSTFQKIASQYDGNTEKGKKAAGAAYWQAAREKYAKAKK